MISKAQKKKIIAVRTWLVESWRSVNKAAHRVRLEVLFIIIFLVFGAIFIAIVPPGWNTDEPDHTYRIYQLSKGDILSEQVTSREGYKAYGGQVPAGLVRIYDETGVRGSGTVVNLNVKVADVYQKYPDIKTAKDDGNMTVTNFSGAALYSPVAYAPYVPIFWVGRHLSLTFFQMIILCRIVGLLLSGLAFFYAIKIIPFGKWILFAVGLLPVVITQAATVGADAPQMFLSILFLAWLTRTVFSSTPPRWLDYGALTAIGAALALTKFAYAPFVLLILIIPMVRKRAESKKQWLLSIASILVAIIPSLIWIHLVSYVDINSNPHANFALQEKFVLCHPIRYLQVLYYTFFSNEQAPLGDIFGSFNWASAPLPALYSYLASIMLVLSVCIKSGREKSIIAMNIKTRRIWRGMLIIVSLVTIVIIATALYVYSTTLHQTSIVGLQARYFVPVLPIIALIFYGNTLKNVGKVKAGIVLLSCIILIGAVLTVYQRLYLTVPILFS